MSQFDLVHRWAHYYVSSGLAVIPLWYLRDDGACACGEVGCARAGKHPWYGEAWDHVSHIASTEDHVDFFWSGEHPWNIGIVGDQSLVGGSDLIVIHANGGMAVTKQLREFNRRVAGVVGLPKTREAVTPTSGRHLYFRIAEGLQHAGVSCIADRVALDEFPGLSVIARGGYVVAAPSVEEAGGWRWAPESGGLVDAPEGLLAYLHQVSEVMVGFGSVLTETSPWYQGMRDHTDVGNARRLVDHFGGRIRHTYGMGWAYWSDKWRVDRSGSRGGQAGILVRGLAQRIPDVIDVEAESIREDVAECVAAGDAEAETAARRRLRQKLKRKEEAGSATKIRHTLEQAEADPRIMTNVGAWDRHHYLLGVRNGVVNLRTGELSGMAQDLLITHEAPVTYEPDARSVVFDQFLHDVTQGDESMQRFLQKAVGLTLTGERKDVFFLVHGEPGTGKSTFLDLIQGMIGSYCEKLDATAITEKRGRMQSVSEDKYDRGKLLGKRFVYVSEIEEGSDLKAEMVKPLTGDGRISGRLPYGASFDIPVTMTLWIGTNHQPFVKDPAIWRRVKAIKFRHKPDPPDETVRERILSQDGDAMRAAFAWAVRGAVEFYANSDLNFCGVVENETAIYRRNEDLLGQFLNEMYEEGEESDSMPLEVVYSAYLMWNADMGRKEWAKDVLRRKLVDAGMMDQEERTHVRKIRVRKSSVKHTPIGTLRALDGSDSPLAY